MNDSSRFSETNSEYVNFYKVECRTDEVYFFRYSKFLDTWDIRKIVYFNGSDSLIDY